MQGFLEQNGPSHEEELEELLSGRQVRLVRAAFLTGNHGFYQLDQGDCTFVYHLGPEFQWLAPRAPAEEDSSSSTALFLACEDVPQAEKVRWPRAHSPKGCGLNERFLSSGYVPALSIFTCCFLCLFNLKRLTAMR